MVTGARRAILGVAGVAVLALAAPASAAELLSARMASTGSVFRVCSDEPLASGAGVARRAVTAPAMGWVTARLDGGRGDWDVSIFDAASGYLVAGSAGFRADEVASGIVTAGQRLTVQACRLSGGDSRAQLDVDFSAIDTTRQPEQLSLVRVSTPNRDRKEQLNALGLDLTEHGGPGYVEVVLHGEDDARRLRRNKFVFSSEVRDLAARTVADRRAEAAYASRVRASALPSRRDTYRRLNDYGEDMKRLVRENPNLVKPITLPFRTWTGMAVEGIEISTNVNQNDGKPVFLNMGAHHAREWPSSEHAMEWAFELVNGFRNGDARVRRLVGQTRTIVIPLVNPEGFNTSREAGQAAGAGNGRGGPVEEPNLVIPYEYQRKNCRVVNPDGDDPAEGNCQQQPATGVQQFGVDPNRNYGGLWGGPGATPPGGTPPGDYAQAYRGPGPFSEPETRNIRALVSSRHVVTLITNHTFSNLVLRPPGLASQGFAPDEALLRELGDAMADENGYVNQYSWQLYDTSGTTEDWTYFATGGLGYTFEIGPNNFHPPFQEVVNEYEGNTDAADAGGRDGKGNREAYFKAQESTANPTRHAVLAGASQPGSVLRLSKSFKTLTSPVLNEEGEEGEPIAFDDNLNVTMEPTASTFEWHINQSTRPISAPRGRDRTGDPSPPIERELQPPPPGACPGYFLEPDTRTPNCWTDQAFDIQPNGGGVDNGFAKVDVTWPTEASDYDLEIYRDSNGDGSSMNEGRPVASSALGQTDFETTRLGPDPTPGKYVARVINFAGGEPYSFAVTFEPPEPFKPGTTESWRLTCETFSGTVMTSQDVTIGRGQRQDPGLRSCVEAFRRAFASGRGCDRPTGRVFRKGLDRARLGRDRLDHLRRYRIGLRGRRNLDKFCLSDRRAVRIGYPTARLLQRNLGRRGRRSAFTSRKAVMVLTSSRRFRVRRVRVGMRPALMRARIGRRIRPIRIGANRWYARRGSRATLLFKVRAGRVREVGHASRQLANTRRKTARLLRSFPLR
ncbi:MAG TPA: M14 family zinc carboxypeptidase [Thermoleophilaceae bacterium]|nr:M14 family zinc carboxypeptidase [Thermoleophilaceae bacterium]